jgi:hypothetical protein
MSALVNVTESWSRLALLATEVCLSLMSHGSLKEGSAVAGR